MNGSNRIRLLRSQAAVAVDRRADVAARAVGYIRVSTEEQAANGYGLEIQSSAIRSFAHSQGYELLDVISDAAVSGAKAPKHRPGFRRVMELAEAHEFSILVVWKFDRLARSLLYSVTTVNELQERHGVVLRSVTEPIDTATPMGAMIFAILASFAAEERRVITSRTLAGKKHKAMRGGFAGGPAPLGYVPDLRGGLGVDVPAAATIRHISDLREQGLSLRMIASTLNADG
jgi:site-specific DNA recombinase